MPNVSARVAPPSTAATPAGVPPDTPRSKTDYGLEALSTEISIRVPSRRASTAVSMRPSSAGTDAVATTPSSNSKT